MYSRALQKEHLVGSKRIAKPAEGRVASGAHNAVAQYRGADSRAPAFNHNAFFRRSVANARRPEYMTVGFARIDSHAPWHTVYDGDTRKPIEKFEAETCGFPRVVPRRVADLPSFGDVDRSDRRSYRPDVCPDPHASLTVAVPAGPRERILVARDVEGLEATAFGGKFHTYGESTRRTRLQMEDNRYRHTKSEVQKTIAGTNSPVKKPTLCVAERGGCWAAAAAALMLCYCC